MVFPDDSSMQGSGFPAQVPQGLDIEPYRVRNPVEVVHTLNHLVHHADLVAIYFNQGCDSMLTALVHVDVRHGQLVFDWGGSEIMNRRLLGSGRNVFVATQDGIKLQFATGPAQAGVFGGRKAFIAPLPTELIKLQRREFFRVITPVMHPLRCLLPVYEPSALELSVHDISLGGMGLMVPAELAGFEVGATHPGCRLALPGYGMIRTGLEVRHRQASQWHSGREMRLTGVRFLDITPPMQAQLQRYIIQVQRDRRALTS